jgi:hypothetical protein
MFVLEIGLIEGRLAPTAVRSERLAREQNSKKSATNFEHKCALVCRIRVSFGCDQQLTHCRVTIGGSDMQCGGLATRTENQIRFSKTRHSTKSNLKRKSALLCRVHVSFAGNKPLTRFNATMQCREMQSGGFKTGTERRKQTSKTQNSTKISNKF